MKRPAGRGAAALALGLAALASILPAPACGDGGTHAFVGRLYVEARGCLGTPSTVDVLSGDEPGECAPICLLQRRAEGGRAIYVALMCPPYPGPEFDWSGSDPSCAPALDALARGDTCLSDGGSTRPVVDAGPDAGRD